MRVLVIFFSLCSYAFAQTSDSSGAATLSEQRSQLIRATFNSLRPNDQSLFDQFYAEDIVFEDPLGEVQGLAAIKKYFQTRYKNVREIRFEFKPDAITGDRHLVTWVKYLRMEGLNGGDEVAIHGVSEIEFQVQEAQVIYQRDYFDMGEFLYENVPVLGPVIRLIKKQLEYKEESGN